MTMTAAGLAAAMKAEQGDAQDESIQDDANLKQATAIINYITANALTTLNNGVDSGGDTLTDLTGSVS